MYLLDTNICAYFISGKYPRVTKRFYACEPNEICISSITAAELAYGVENSARGSEPGQPGGFLEAGASIALEQKRHVALRPAEDSFVEGRDEDR